MVQTCRTEKKETIGGLADVWHEMAERPGFVFGAYLAIPSDEVHELQDGSSVRMVYAVDRFSRVYVLDAAQKPVCRFEYDYGEPIVIAPSPAGTFVLISPGTGAVRKIQIIHRFSCALVVDKMGLLDARPYWDDESLLFQEAQSDRNGCRLIEYRFERGELRKTGREEDTGPAAEC